MPEPSQCKVPLDRAKPNINICIKDEGHTESSDSKTKMHYTYGLGWTHIYFV